MPDIPASDRGAAIVTGGRRGIGAAIAAALARAGFSVAICDLIRDAAAERTLDSIAAAGGKTLFLTADIADTDCHQSIIEQTSAAFGPITCLVNNAGTQVSVRGDMLAAPIADFDRVIGVNLRGTFFLTQAVGRHMAEAPKTAAPRSVIVISSANAHMVSPEKAIYCLSKSALSMLSKLYAARLAEFGIDVFEIQPGLIKTDMNAAVHDSYGAAIEAGMSLTRRWGLPEDVAAVAAALATGQLPFITGTTLPVGGGLHVHRL